MAGDFNMLDFEQNKKVQNFLNIVWPQHDASYK